MFTRIGLLLLVGFAVLRCACARAAESEPKVEQWGTFEASYHGPSTGNPFVDVSFSATFTSGSESFDVPGFYDGDGTYRVRFMPDTIGTWAYVTKSNAPALTLQSGTFIATPAGPANHGPVHVVDQYHFGYADGAPYREIGTTCYAWIQQSNALQQQTLKTLASSPFNKLRMCVFPKWYEYNRAEPPIYPFVGTAPNKWDYTQFNPEYFRHLEKRVADLRALDIEADIILFHPYDGGHWGFDRMGAENDDRYARYVVARLSAYRNVWWALANEWDLVKAKTPDDWNRLGNLIAQEDPYHHLRSIHQSAKMFDSSVSWITHISYQNDHPEDGGALIAQYGKPLIYDECRYEGNIPKQWGCITPQRMTTMFWIALTSGAWCGHSETYLGPSLWWSHGGVLKGQSPARIAFFKKIIDAAPADGVPLKPRYIWGVTGKYYLLYLRDMQPASYPIDLPADAKFKASIIDTYAMTITPLPGYYSGHASIPLPQKQWQAVRLTLAK
jgi:hypothetical protein